MHLFAVLDAGRMSQVESLADLYGVVTEELLAGQERRHGMSPHQTGEMRSGPARMALVHDSFLDYFQARDLHAHLGLEAVRMAEDLDPRWAHEVVASVRADPSGWFLRSRIPRRIAHAGTDRILADGVPPGGQRAGGVEQAARVARAATAAAQRLRRRSIA